MIRHLLAIRRSRVAGMMLACQLGGLPALAQPASVPAEQNSALETKLAAAPQTINPGEIKPGMRGITRTVIRGSEIIDVETEILGVEVGGLGPGYDMIIGKLVDKRTEKTGAVHGMSGSPLYIVMPDGTERLAGALSRRIAFFEKDGHCGFTPIKDMFEVDAKVQRDAPNKKQSVRANWSRRQIADLGTGEFPNDRFAGVVPQALLDRYRAAGRDTVRVETLAVPLTISGVRPEIWNHIAKEIGFPNQGFLPVAGGGNASESSAKLGSEALQPGAPVAAVLMTGDIAIAGTGTLTWREGDRVLGFGHPMMGLGKTAFGMGTAEIVTTVPSYAVPYKLSNLGRVVGTVSQDRWSAIGGRVGEMPAMAPYRVVRFHEGKKRDVVKGEFAQLPDFASMLMMTATISPLTNDDMSRERTIRLSGRLKLKGYDEPLSLTGFSSGSGFFAESSAVMKALQPVMAIYGQEYEEPQAEEFEMKIETTEEEKVLSIESVTLNRAKMKPGEEVEAIIELLPKFGERRFERIKLRLPENLREGSVSIRVANADSLNSDQSLRLRSADDVAGMIRALNERRTPGRLYIQLTTSAGGRVIGQRKLPALPPTVSSIMDAGNTTERDPGLNEVVWLEKSISANGFVVMGSRQLSIEIE